MFGTEQQATLTSIWSDHLLERPENHMTGVSFSRGGYHRIGKRVTNGAGGYTVHRADHWLFDDTGLDYGDVLGGAARVVGYECDGCDFTYRDGLPYPTGSDGTPSNFEILGTAPAAHFTRTTASRPPPPGVPGEDEFIASRLFNSRDADAVERISHGHAVLGSYTSAAGGIVVTSGSTEWAHGLAERDQQIEQITRNMFTAHGWAGWPIREAGRVVIRLRWLVSLLLLVACSSAVAEPVADGSGTARECGRGGSRRHP